ncbi:response regulator [Priestia endophytica]|uniref:response regulator n=1 Tax=Priestia endophytica TaxID=135735 RepID=UPI000DCA3686|nr:response regulator [Priestia endophytica]RAS81182.1 DNA-binding response regulator [Priestia endophytica]
MLRVAIAEDDFRIADIQEKFLLKIEETEVVGKAFNAEQTMELLRENEADLLLLDIYLPDQTGIDLLPSLKQEFRDLDVILITAAREKELLERALKIGVENYLIKPVSAEKFTEAIKKYKKKKEMLQSAEEIDQTFVELFFKGIHEASAAEKQLPSGIDPLTLEKITKVMNQFHKGASIEEVSEAMGASRTTARRYLEYLVSIQRLRAELEYGIVGRPERKYYLIASEE